MTITKLFFCLNLTNHFTTLTMWHCAFLQAWYEADIKHIYETIFGSETSTFICGNVQCQHFFWWLCWLMMTEVDDVHLHSFPQSVLTLFGQPHCWPRPQEILLKSMSYKQTVYLITQTNIIPYIWFIAILTGWKLHIAAFKCPPTLPSASNSRRSPKIETSPMNKSVNQNRTTRSIRPPRRWQTQTLCVQEESIVFVSFPSLEWIFC